MQDHERCCGTGTCIIDAQGRYWCGQQWGGQKMCHPAALSSNNMPASQLVQPEKEGDSK